MWQVNHQPAGGGARGPGVRAQRHSTRCLAHAFHCSHTDIHVVLGWQATISRMEAAVADQARAHGGALARSASGLGAQATGVVRPFDAQRAAIGDRRYLGMYDARFHSTHWCAGAPAASVCRAMSALWAKRQARRGIFVSKFWAAGVQQARTKRMMDAASRDYRLFSPRENPPGSEVSIIVI